MVLSRMVGAEVRRKEDPRLITGSSTYVDDLKITGMANVAMVRSPYPHATIRSIEVLGTIQADAGVKAALDACRTNKGTR